ncbi:methionyl-tRNA formyltransferase [Paenibacillus sp. GCM10027626]|uniref:methionyl-tRNA formyltransferase n=1 Tax=Paenibacillus sp. GCM10027626 TaxID=3273411 RepID=UPI00362E1F91
MRIVFMGTPEFAVPSLEALVAAGHQIAAVVTQPDRPKGRKKVMTPPPVKEAAQARGFTVYQPEKLRGSSAVDELVKLAPDLIVTAAYGQILPKRVLDIPRLGCINVHGSLLPRYRGGAPIQRAIMNGEEVTGVTIMYMAEGLDTGDMISKVVVRIEEEDTAGSIFAKLSEAGAKLLLETLPALEEGTVTAEKQNDAEATYAANLTRADEQIDWRRSARQLFNQVRGLSPMAGAFTMLDGAPFKVWGCKPEAEVSAGKTPGTVLAADTDGIVVQTGEGALRLLVIQPAGKKAMAAAEWLKGARLAAGTQFGGEQS